MIDLHFETTFGKRAVARNVTMLFTKTGNNYMVEFTTEKEPIVI